MKKTFQIIVIALLALSLIAAELPPQLPSSFYGTVTGYPAEQKINVWRDGVKVASTTAFYYEGWGVVYALDVPGLITDEGKALTFKTNGVVIGRGVWHSGTNVQLNLAAPAKR